MKLHYFLQTDADADDMIIQIMKETGAVPPNCLLGGVVARAMVTNGKPPCDTCKGPRSKCGGTPELTDEELSRSFEQQRLAGLFTGDSPSSLEELLRRKP